MRIKEDGTLETLDATRRTAMLAAHLAEEAGLARIDAEADPTLEDYTESEQAERLMVLDIYEKETSIIQAGFLAALAELPTREQARYKAQRAADRADADI